jgi:hypothetical protein
MVEYTVSDGTNTFPLAELEISYTGTELDEAQFLIAGVIALEASITIYAGTTAQFVGYVKEVEEVEQGALYKYTAYEKAVELKTMPYLSSTLDIFTKSAITIANLATDILTSAPDSTWDLAAGMADTTSVTMNFYMVNRLQALNKVLREMRGYFVLFDSTAKTVKFLTSTGINTDRSATDMVYQSKTLISSSMLRGITQVVVIGKDSSIRGTYGSSTSSRAYYQVDDIATNDEALKIATAIFGDIGVTYADYKVTVSPDEIQYDVRDKVKVDGSYYWIKSIIQSMEDIEMILDDGRTSVIESFGSRIHLIEGNFPSGSDQQWSGEWQNIPPAGQSAVYNIDIKDINLISNFILAADVSDYRTDVTIAAETEFLSDISQVASSTAYTTITFFASGYTSLATASVSLTNGSQFGMATLTGDFFCNTDGDHQLIINCQYSNDNSTWTASSVYGDYLLQAGVVTPINLSILIPGTTSTLQYVKFVVYVGGTNQIRLRSGALTAIQRTSRHKHTQNKVVQRTTDSSLPAATNLGCNINGSAHSYTMPLTSDDITAHLITGKNEIRFYYNAAGYGAIKPRATYQTLGKS